jgi:L-iditol 2-dehydrogenase
MRTARLHAPGDIRVTTEEAAPDAPGRSRVRVTSVGLCGSDLHWFTEGAIGDAVLRRPLVLGHEIAGVVLDGPMAGATVGVDPAVPCGRCATCARGDGHLCPTVAFSGHGGVDGGLQEEMVWPDHLLHRLPDGYDGAQGTLLEPLGVAVHALDLSHVRAGATVGVVGCGPIGLLLIQLVRASGAHVVAVEPRPHRVDAARRAGAAVAVTPDGLAGLAELDSCDVVFEVSGADAGLAHAGHLLRPGGRIVLVGIPDEDATTFQASLMRRKGVTLACVRRMTEAAYARGITLALQGVVDLTWLTSHRFPLDKAAEAFSVAAAREGLKVVVDVS